MLPAPAGGEQRQLSACRPLKSDLRHARGRGTETGCGVVVSPAWLTTRPAKFMSSPRSGLKRNHLPEQRRSEFCADFSASEKATGAQKEAGEERTLF